MSIQAMAVLGTTITNNKPKARAGYPALFLSRTSQHAQRKSTLDVRDRKTNVYICFSITYIHCRYDQIHLLIVLNEALHFST